MPPARAADARAHGAYIVALWRAGDDCRTKLRNVKIWSQK